MKNLFLLLFIIAGLVGSAATAQITIEQYQKADSVLKLADLVYNQVQRVDWIDSTNTLWYSIKTREGTEYKFVDAEKQSQTLAFDTQKLVDALNGQLDKKVTHKSLQLRNLKFDREKQSIQFVYENARWTCNLNDYTLSKDSVWEPRKQRDGYWGRPFNELEGDPVDSPDKAWTAFIKNFNVYVKNNKGEEHQLSYDGAPGEYYSSYFSWSPDAKKLAVNKVRKNEDRFIYFIESSPDSQLQPILQKRYYLKPGDDLPVKHPALFDIESLKQIPVDTHDFENQYELSNPKWNKNSLTFTFEYNQRGHQVYKVASVDAESGKVKVIINENSPTFIDYSGKRFRYDLEESKEIIWASERDGWNHLYLYNSETGEVKNQITAGEWVVRQVLHVDEKNRVVYFYGAGKNEGEDPYFLHCYKVNFDGSNLLDLTPEKMNHDVTFAENYDYFTDTYSTVQTPPVTVLRSAVDGKVLLELEKTDIADLLDKGWIAPESFVAKARDGKTDIWGNIYRPTHFNKNKTYPVIEYIYAGPQGAFAQKSFNPVSYAYSSLAELGFIIVQMDGMGTSYRSKAFHDVCWKNLKDAGFPDRILWMQAAAKKYKYMDITRVGIFGGSAGGQNALAGLLFHPEFYKAGVASCGCHDNRMDKMWWNEQWMGYPIGPEYAECSNVDNAGNLQGKLMLIVGEMDDNVDPASTMQVADALIKAKKDFELVVLPGTNHTLGGTYGEQKRRDFFVRNLLDKKTPNWNITSK
ncbi:S9 family peptidase [Maribellus sp. YY47]|uniref:S9 family peptidase n=1 Tax=Maribellus sp. YY47 TaxID=2929486 RepID=UPI002001CF15|nr:S9 family peptidase [Maribellus sp. YY47]MCK3684831.1 S9 family peptidase [Maribellus sp. YY47]